VARRLRTLERGDTCDTYDLDLAHLSRHLDACPGCEARFGARFRLLEARQALRRREAPDGVFDAFFDDVWMRLDRAPAGGGLSTAFLDAPRALRVWRATAFAAMVVVGVGTGYVMNVLPSGTRADPSAREKRLDEVPRRLLPGWKSGTFVTAPALAPADRYLHVDPVEPPVPGSDDAAHAEHWD
jgi:hypothetical protein